MSDDTLIKNLLIPAAYDHPVKHIKVLETHISWVILTGDYAYKIKKPVDFGFLNYSTLEKRKFYCDEELRLNQLFASKLYLDVVPINGTVDKPHIGGEGNLLEYAIKMREFSQEGLFTSILQQKKLTAELVDSLADLVAAFHQKTPVAEKNLEFGTPQHVHAPVVQNFDQILPLLTDEEDKRQLARLQQWSDQQFKQHHHLFQQRKEHGFIRDCHGDLHMGNIILFDQKPMLFDRIEFNDDLRWNDILADTAFLAMDMEEHQQFTFAKRFLNRYFSLTGDYQGLAILPYYQAYRAIVRAKISLIHAQQQGLSSAEQQALKEKYRKFMNLAETYTRTSQAKLFITHGLTGSGKSVFAQVLAENIAAFQVRSDIVRKQLLGFTPNANTKSAVNQGAYDFSITEKTYTQLARIAEIIIKAGFSAIIDASFLKQTQREDFQHLATELKIPFIILDCQVTRDQIEQWIKKRQHAGLDPSEGRLEVLTMQQETAEPLTQEEMKHTLVVNTSQIMIEEIIKQINNKVAKI